MSASILLPTAGGVIAAAAGVLIRVRRERADKRVREGFKNVLKLEKKLNSAKNSPEKNNHACGVG